MNRKIKKLFTVFFIITCFIVNALCAQKSTYNIKYRTLDNKGNVIPAADNSKAFEIVKNLVLFEKEEFKNNMMKNQCFVLDEKFEEKKEFLIEARSLLEDEKIIKTYEVKNINFSKDSHLINSLSFSMKWGKDNETRYYSIYNTNFDDSENILKRIITTHSKPKTKTFFNAHNHFLEGKVISYKNYIAPDAPSSFLIKTFLMTPGGKFRWISEQESLNRSYNDMGYLESESVRETTYSYKENLTGYEIHNLSLHENGDVKGYDVIFIQPDNTTLEPLHLNITITKSKNDLSIKKIIRKFKIADGEKLFLSGETETLEKDEQGNILYCKISSFKIKFDTLGLCDDEKINETSKFIFNKFSDDNLLTKKTIIETHCKIDPNTNLEDEFLKTFREVNFFYENNNDLISINVRFLNYSETLDRVEVKNIKIDILEKMQSGEASRIKLKIFEPLNTTEPVYEEILNQDSSYIINEAISGELFYSPEEQDYEIKIKNIDNTGNFEVELKKEKNSHRGTEVIKK